MSDASEARWTSGLPGFFWLTRRKFPVTHHGIARRDRFGRVEVLELKPSGTRVTDLEGFADGQALRVVDFKPLSEQAELQPRIARVLGRRNPYALLTWNCEHLASEIWRGSSESRQVTGGLLVGVLALFAGVAALRR